MELSFIYNAQSGKTNALIDFTHKILSPETYQNQLCSLIYGNIEIEENPELKETIIKKINENQS